MWEVEKHFPDEDFLYIRVGEGYVSRDLKPRAVAFSNTPKNGTNLSSDWSKHCTPESSRELTGKQKNIKGEYKNPLSFSIWQFNIGKLRQIVKPLQNIKHEPLYNNPEIDGEPNNRAHSIIIGDKPDNLEFRALMVLAGEWAIPPTKK